MTKSKQSELLKGVITTDLINTIINRGIQYFFLKYKMIMSITLHSITNVIYIV